MTLKTFLSRFLFISVLGVLLHFTYEWSGDNPIVALFSAVNESTWEHLKLLFFPMLLLTIIELLFTEKRQLPSNYLFARTIGILSGMAFIVIAFYTLTGVFAKLPDAVNIALYFLGVFLALCIENKPRQQPESLCFCRDRTPCSHDCIFCFYQISSIHWPFCQSGSYRFSPIRRS